MGFQYTLGKQNERACDRLHIQSGKNHWLFLAVCFVLTERSTSSFHATRREQPPWQKDLLGRLRPKAGTNSAQTSPRSRPHLSSTLPKVWSTCHICHVSLPKNVEVCLVQYPGERFALAHMKGSKDSDANAVDSEPIITILSHWTTGQFTPSKWEQIEEN